MLGQFVAQGTKLGEIKSLGRVSGENQPDINRRSLRFMEAAIMQATYTRGVPLLISF